MHGPCRGPHRSLPPYDAAPSAGSSPVPSGGGAGPTSLSSSSRLRRSSSSRAIASLRERPTSPPAAGAAAALPPGACLAGTWGGPGTCTRAGTPPAALPPRRQQSTQTPLPYPRRCPLRRTSRRRPWRGRGPDADRRGALHAKAPRRRGSRQAAPTRARGSRSPADCLPRFPPTRASPARGWECCARGSGDPGPPGTAASGGDIRRGPLLPENPRHRSQTNPASQPAGRASASVLAQGHTGRSPVAPLTSGRARRRG